MVKHIQVLRETAALARRIALIALLSVLALSLVACGGESAPAAQATVGPTQPAGIPQSTAALIPTAASDVATPPGVGDAGSGVMDLMTIGDPCALLTQSEVVAILGQVAVKTDDSVRSPTRLACIYVPPTQQADGTKGGPRLSIAVESTMNWVGIPTMAEGVQPVAGIGDGGYTYTADGELSLWVLVKGKAIINVALFPRDLEKAKQLATQIIAKLP